jgi:hypothetical protein
MPKAQANPVERSEHSARPCFEDLPYRALVFVKRNEAGVPLYRVAGSAMSECAASTALKEAFAVHRGNCFHCKKPISKANFSIDHVEPLARGGSDSIQNLVIAHKSCNQAKGSQAIEAYNKEAGREWLQALLLQIEDRLKRLDASGG